MNFPHLQHCCVHRAAEIKNFVEVLEHPAFKKDPLGTIHLHLTNARKRGLI